MDSESAQNEWELSKENVQPLRTGRKVLSLNESLLQSSDRMSRIREEKHAFESELRAYTGDDPLDIWYRYIKWTEEMFPKGGKESNLTTILQQCVKQYKDEQKYCNDERYIYAWMRMADMVNEPLEVYSFMYDQNIGCELSCFYDGWASVLEQLGDTRRADAVYANGMKKGARPLEMLKNKHEEFQKRVARGIMRGQEDAGGGGSPMEEAGGQRQVLSQLKTHGSKAQVPVNRVGGAIKGNAGVLSGARPKAAQQVGSKGIQVFCDENQAPGSLQPQTGEWATIPSRPVTNKENEKKAGIWKNQKIKTPAGVKVPISEVNSHVQPKFTVHVDEDVGRQTMRTPAKMPELGSQVLSARKNDPTMTNYLKNMSLPAEQNKNEKPMYCKDKIYCGAEEYSLEEIRAVHWARKQETMRKEAELQESQERFESERQRLLEERERVREETERLRQERLRLQQEEEAMLEEASRKRQAHLEQMERDRMAEIQRQQQLVEASIQKRLQEQIQLSQNIPNKSVRQLFDDSSQGSTEQMFGQMATYSMNGQQQQQPHGSLSQSLNSSRGTPNSQPPLNTSQSRSAEKTHSGAPSPTVHMKEAMSIVLGMFRTSTDINKKQKARQEDVDMDESSIHPVERDVKAAPFSIFCDDGQSARAPAAAPTGFRIFTDDDEINLAEPAPAPAPKAPVPATFKIFTDNQHSEDQAMLSAKKQAPAALGGLKFRAGAGQETENGPAAVTISQVKDEEDVVMEESVRSSTTRALFDDEEIESHARDDITLAPVSSHLSFAAAAKIASTPFQPNLDGRSHSPALDVSDVEMPEAVKAPSPDKARDNLDQSAGNASNTSSGSFRNLSPIMEGSSEDSGANSKSSNHHHTTLEPRAVPVMTLTPVQDMSDDMHSFLHSFDENNQSTHVIDTTAYIPPEMDEKTENLLSMTINIVDPEDPFDMDMKEEFLRKLAKPLLHYDNFNISDDFMPEIKKGHTLNLGLNMYTVQSKIGEGGFAKVYLADSDDFDMMTSMLCEEEAKKVAIKVETPPQKWEFYVCSVLHERLGALGDMFDARPAVMQVSNGYFFRNTSCLVTDFHPYGTILEFVNKCKATSSGAVLEQLEPAVTYMTIELLHMVENMHRCQIIHGDIKPDNFLILQLPELPMSSDPAEVFGGNNRFCQLIDFGQGIDMSQYPKGTTFLAKVNTKCFQCVEMKTNRPWSYQTDLFGLAGTIHVLIFHQYMKVYPARGEWKMTSRFPRNWNTDLWKSLFHILLNVPSCDLLPDLSLIRRSFEQFFLSSLLQKYNQQRIPLSKTLQECAKKLH